MSAEQQAARRRTPGYRVDRHASDGEREDQLLVAAAGPSHDHHQQQPSTATAAEASTSRVHSQSPDRLRPAPPPPQSCSRSTPLKLRGIDQLERKQCYVCYEESTADNDDPTRPWVHACACTLVAHQDCLLEWVTTYQQTHSKAPACPVCGTPYIIREQSIPLLKLYKKLVRRWERMSMIIALTSVSGSAIAMSGLYGVWAIKAWAGKDVARALFDRKWPLSYYFNLPLVPVTLILSRTTLIDSLLPFLPLTLVLTTSAPAMPRVDPSGIDNLSLTYPPSPILTLCLLPWLRVIYFRLRSRLYSFFLGPQSRLTGFAGFMADMEAEQVEDPVGPQVVADVEVEIENGAHPNEEPQRAEGRLRVGLGRFASLIVGALLFPALASSAGSALYWLAQKRGMGFLRRVLGLSSIWSKSPSISTSTASWLLSMGRNGNGNGSRAVDPVWIRNTLGAGIVLLLRDMVKISASLLEQKRKASRRVVGRPFGANLELDSRPPSRTTAMNGPRDMAAGADSGGRDRNGREAIVRTML